MFYGYFWKYVRFLKISWYFDSLPCVPLKHKATNACCCQFTPSSSNYPSQALYSFMVRWPSVGYVLGAVAVACSSYKNHPKLVLKSIAITNDSDK